MRFAELEPGAETTFPITLVMPASTIDVYVNLYYGAAGQGEATYAGYRGPYTILVKVDEWAELTKPAWAKDVLDSGVLNWERGDWVDWWIVVVPPFSFTPGLWIEKAIDFALNGLNIIINWSKRAWDAQWEQNLGIVGVIRGLAEDVSDLRNIVQDAGSIFDSIFTRVVEEIVKVEPFKTIISAVNTILDFLPEDWAELKNLLTNPIDYLLDQLDEYLYGEGET